MKRMKRRPVWLWIVLSVAVAALVLFISEISSQRALGSLERLAKRGQASAAVQTVMRRLLDAETAQRGYLITGRPEYLQPLAEVPSDIARAIDLLRRHHAADATLGATVEELSRRSLERLSEVTEIIALYEAGSDDNWRRVVMTDIGREKMALARTAAETLLAAEERAVKIERAEVQQTLNAGRLSLGAMTLLSLLALVFFFRNTAVLQRAQGQHARALQAERDLLETEVAERTAELTELARHLQTAREDERGHLARELHDELGALLTAAKFDVVRLKRALATAAVATPDLSERLAHLNASIDQGIALKRRIIEDLRPSALSNLGLKAALEIQARDFEQRSGLPVQVQIDEVVLSDAAQIVVYRVVQESFTNAAKHAKARSLSLSLVQRAGSVLLRIIDDGVGFRPGAGMVGAHGLVGMRYRVESVGGQWRVISTPGQGTVVEASIPRQEPDPPDPADPAHPAAAVPRVQPGRPVGIP